MPPVEVLETLLRDPVKRPMQALLGPARECALSVHNELVRLVDTLLEKDHVARFPGLVQQIKDAMVEGVLNKGLVVALAQVELLINMEESYVYTDDPAFHAQMQRLFVDTDSGGGVQPGHMRALLQAYFQTAQQSIQNSVPKAVMLCMVKSAQKELTTTLFQSIALGSAQDLLDEPPEVADKREALRNQVKNLASARQALASIR